ncbi:hypothetical protein [Metarhizobium album]|nr:hypothetical protein [Rhizobium album]
MSEKQLRGELYGSSLAESEIGSRLIVAERYADCLRRLARASSEIDRRHLSEQLEDTAGSLDRMAADIASSEHGTEILARAGRLIPVVEKLVESRRKAMALH